MSGLKPGIPPAFHQAEDGKVYVDDSRPMPSVIEVSAELFEGQPSRPWIWNADGRVFIEVANGRWVYRIAEIHYEHGGAVVVCVLEEPIE